jgi:L-alanine-DL-glutamate epimerase-like enolase superfamily enzyme
VDLGGITEYLKVAALAQANFIPVLIMFGVQL